MKTHILVTYCQMTIEQLTSQICESVFISLILYIAEALLPFQIWDPIIILRYCNRNPTTTRPHPYGAAKDVGYTTRSAAQVFSFHDCFPTDCHL
jgi:hypothetical protein